jgi:endonuclease III related protein
MARPQNRQTVPVPGDLRVARRLRSMYDRLVALWGPQQWWPAMGALEVVIGACLTQSTAWKSVERSIGNLRTRGVLSIAGLRAISEGELRVLIRPSGFMLRKAAALKAFVSFLDAQYSGRMEPLVRAARRDSVAVREQLLALPGVGPETADAILLYALEVPAMVVDEYLRRVITRHGLLPEKAKYADIQSLAERAFAADAAAGPSAELADHYNEFHALMVQVGKTHCGRVPRCEGCPLAYDLPKQSPLRAGAGRPHKLDA